MAVFTSETAAVNSARGKRGRKPAKTRSCLAMQDILFAKVSQKDTPPSLLPQLVHAWCELEERIRILRMIPLPGMLKPEVKARPKALPVWSGPTEA